MKQQLYMMRRTMLLLSVMVMPLVMQADNIGKEQARQIASKFMMSAKMHQTDGKSLVRADEPSLSCMDEGYRHLYAFTDTENGGFVIVADDDRIEPVLAYSQTDTYDPLTMPLPMRLMLQSYDQQIGSLAGSHLGTRQSEAPAERGVIAPLIQTMWHQYLPLNYNCPFDNNVGRNTLVGCVALVMAQLMYYYQYPQATTVPIPAYKTGSGYEMPELPLTTFDYEKMHLNYDTADGRDEVDPDDESIAEVTKLLMYAGCAVQMNYSVNGSAAEFDPVVFAKYFGYDKGARRLLAGNYPHDVWEEMVYQELKAGRPVPYLAGAMGNQSHQFIIDGYDGKGYFHVNVGDIGRGGFNGFFRLGVLNMYEDQNGLVEMSGYNLYQSAIFGFQPDKGNDTGVGDEPLPTADPQLKVDQVTYFTAYEGERLDVRAWITNEGTNYENLLTLWIDGEMRTGVGTYVDPGHSDYVDFCTAAPAIGSHKVVIATDMEGRQVVYTGQLTVTEAPKCELEAQTDVQGLRGNKIHGQLDVTCEITNTGEATFTNMVFANIGVYMDGGKGDLMEDIPNGIPGTVWKRMWYVYLEPGESTTLSFSVGKESLKPDGYLYGVSVGYYNNKWRYGTLYSNGYFSYVDDEGTDITTTERTADEGNAGVWYGLSGQRLNSKPTMKGIYINKGKKIVVK